jgi:hypothetical protein
VVRPLARLDLRFFLEGLGVALGLRAHRADLLVGAADGFGGEALPAGDPPEDNADAHDVGDDADGEVHGGGAHRTFYL